MMIVQLNNHIVKVYIQLIMKLMIIQFKNQMEKKVIIQKTHMWMIRQ